MKTFFIEVGKELKWFVGDNVKELVAFGVILLTIILMFVIPKIIMGAICSLLVFGTCVVFLTALIHDMMENNSKGFKHPYLSRALYVIVGVLNCAFFMCLFFLVIKVFFIL